MDDHSEQTNKPINPVPPTIRLSPATGKPSPAIAPKIRPQPPPTALTPAPVSATNAKKETARVNLPPIAERRPDTVTMPPINLTAPEASTPDQDATQRSIRIKRPGTAVLRPPTIDTKKETSRVDIQEALASSEAPQQPKTIRLKRPGTTVIEKAQQPRPDATTAFRIEEAKKSETSRIELPSEASVEMPRRRKTVQIKRSGSGPSTRVISTGNTDSYTAPSEETFITLKADDETTLVFSLVSLAAAIVTCVLLYVLAAQTVIPSLPWPGKL